MVISLPPDFSEFLKLLNLHHVDYLLVGGFAVGFHGYPRATSGMDIWVSQSAENAARVVTAIKAFGFDTPNLTADLFLQRRRIVRMGHPPIRIEVMNEIDGVTFDECQPVRSSLSSMEFRCRLSASLISNETNWPAADPKTSMTCSSFPDSVRKKHLPAPSHQYACACDGEAAVVEAIVGDRQLHRTSGAGGRHRPLPLQSRIPARDLRPHRWLAAHQTLRLRAATDRPLPGRNSLHDTTENVASFSMIQFI